MTGGYRHMDGRQVPAVHIKHSAMASDEVHELYTLLGLRPGLEIIGLDSRGRRRRPDTIGLEMRPLIGIMFFLSNAVEIPQHDQAAGRVTGDLLVIKSQEYR